MKWSKLKAEEEKNELTAEWVMKPGMNGTSQGEWQANSEWRWAEMQPIERSGE